MEPCQNNILSIFCTDTQFHETVPNFAHFTTTLELRMKQGLEGQTRAQWHHDFTNNSINLVCPVTIQSSVVWLFEFSRNRG
jgi:hypothetical protein